VKYCYSTSIVPAIYPIIHKYLVPVIYSIGTPGNLVASGSSLLLPRAAVDTRGQYSTLRYTGASIVRCAMRGQQQQRGAQEMLGVGSPPASSTGEEERRRDEGTGGQSERGRSDCWLVVVRQQELG
jgi:hypothetical protein